MNYGVKLFIFFALILLGEITGTASNIIERTPLEKGNYNNSTSGLERKYIQKNNIRGVNTLTRDMLNEENTIYIIQYDYTLQEDIKIPDGCVLKFEGGSIRGPHTLIGSNTVISSDLIKIIDSGTKLKGSWNIYALYPEWFGAKGDAVTDDTKAMKALNDAMLNIHVKAVLSNKTYLVTGTEVFGDVKDMQYKNMYFEGNSTLFWIPKKKSDVLFKLNNYVRHFEIDGISVSIKNNTGENEAGIVFSINSTGSGNDGNRYSNLRVEGSSVYDKVYKVFDVSGNTHCDKANIENCYFYRFKHLLIINNNEAVGWRFDHCEIYPGQDNTSSTLFKFDKILDRFTVNDCDIILVEGTSLIDVTTEEADNTSRFTFSNNRIEGRLVTGAQKATFHNTIHVNSGQLIMENNNFRLSKGSLIPLDIKTTGTGKAVFSSCNFPINVNMYIQKYKTPPYSIYKQEYKDCKFGKYDIFIADSHNEKIVKPFIDEANISFFEGILVEQCYMGSDLLEFSLVNNNGSAYQHRKMYTKYFSQNYSSPSFLAIPKYQMITKIELMIGDISETLVGANKAVVNFADGAYIKKIDLTHKNIKATNLTLFEGIMFIRSESMNMVKVYIEDGKGKQSIRNCMFSVSYTSPLGESCLAHTSAESPLYVLDSSAK